MKMVKSKNQIERGFVCNSFLNPREGEMLFNDHKTPGACIATLDGYAVIPLEEYAELTGKDFSDMLADVTPTKY